MAYLTILLSILAVSMAIYHYYLKNRNVFKRHGIPHVQPLPILGNMGPVFAMRVTMADMLQQVYNVQPDAKYVGFYEFTKPLIYVRDLDLIKSIGVKHFDHFQDHRPFIDPRVDTMLGKSLFFRKGDDWKNLRNSLSPVFTSSKIKAMYTLMSDCAVRFADYLSTLPAKEREVDMKAVLCKYTNDVIASCAFGIEVDSIKHPDNELYTNGRQAIVFVGVVQFIKLLICRNIPALSRLLNIRIMPKRIAEFYENLVQDTMRTREEKGIYRPDMLQVMMDIKRKDHQSDKALNDSDIVSNVFGFYFGGFDTVASQTSFVFRLLAEQPDVQAKLQAEIDEVFESNGGRLPYDAITSMVYLDAVVNETLRLYALALFADRLCTKSFELPPAVPGAKPFVVQPGMNLWIPVWAIHRDPRYYEEPDKFDPERFVREGKKIVNSGAFIPWGVGPRMCIGNRFALTKVKVLLCHVLARCNVKCGPKTHIPLELVKGSLMMAPKHGFWVKIEPR